MKKSSRSSPHFCNVLQVGREFRQLWQFSARNSNVNLLSHRKLPAQVPLPAPIVAKDWKTVLQSKLNIAWLPADQVYLRVIHLPASEPQEVLSMVELQLEKLSPLPVNQIVWSVELLPRTGENLQTVIVIIAARDLVEQFLGQLEASGYIADRLEIPCLHQLLEKEGNEDGVWVYPMLQAGTSLCLVAWRFGSTLQQLQLIHLPEGENRTALVVEQLTKTAWAGEIEGWLTSQVRCHLVADAATAALWEPALRQWAGAPLATSEPLSEGKLGELSARRASRGETQANLLPAEYAARYQQQLVDRLWMGGLAGVLAIYVVGVLIYFGALQVAKYQCYQVENKVAQISNDYTNAVRLKEKIDVLQNQLHLKYAALDCFKVVAEELPTDLTLDSFIFQRGQKIVLTGTAPPEQTAQITDFNEAMRRAKVDGQPLFKPTGVSGPKWVNRAGIGGAANLHWDFSCELNRRETE